MRAPCGSTRCRIPNPINKGLDYENADVSNHQDLLFAKRCEPIKIDQIDGFVFGDCFSLSHFFSSDDNGNTSVVVIVVVIACCRIVFYIFSSPIPSQKRIASLAVLRSQ